MTTSSSVPVLCLMAVMAITIGTATARVEMIARPSVPLPPQFDALKGERDDHYGPMRSAIMDDYGGWGPAPNTGGGQAAPIPHPAISSAANSRPHDRAEPTVRSSKGRVSVLDTEYRLL
ncbi:hypothetical protein ACJRO7_023549 [Eucalyptus globulus]|uniref:Uncharacterized protein n=1 Tax=Eucalyptus globulus TaxID=34317 RepID=A0ABD3K3E5_EUCGL